MPYLSFRVTFSSWTKVIDMEAREEREFVGLSMITFGLEAGSPSTQLQLSSGQIFPSDALEWRVRLTVYSEGETKNRAVRLSFAPPSDRSPQHNLKVNASLSHGDFQQLLSAVMAGRPPDRVELRLVKAISETNSETLVLDAGSPISTIKWNNETFGVIDVTSIAFYGASKSISPDLFEEYSKGGLDVRVG